MTDTRLDQTELPKWAQILVQRRRQAGHLEGREEGREEGLATLRRSLVSVLDARGIPADEAGRARIAACRDVDALGRCISRAATADTADEALAELPASEPR